MPQEKVIQSGQFTLPRLLFLAAAGGVIVAAVALGGVFLTVGYMLMTLAICVLLYLIAIDYGVNIEKVNLQKSPTQTEASAPAAPAEVAGASTVTAAPELRAKRRANRPVKRRR